MQPRVWQIEAGFFNTRVGAANSTSAGDLLLRYGVSECAELRLIGLSYGISGGVRGWLDPSIGFKLRLNKAPTEIALIGQSSVPVGQGALRANRWNPTLKLAWSHSLGVPTVGGNLAVAAIGSGSGRFTQSALSVWLSRPLNSRTTVVFEAWGVDRISQGGPSASFASLATAYLIDNDTQVDLRLGTGFHQRRDGWFLQGGISFRF